MILVDIVEVAESAAIVVQKLLISVGPTLDNVVERSSSADKVLPVLVAAVVLLL